jgi:hypothetical protein
MMREPCFSALGVLVITPKLDEVRDMLGLASFPEMRGSFHHTHCAGSPPRSHHVPDPQRLPSRWGEHRHVLDHGNPLSHVLFKTG